MPNARSPDNYNRLIDRTEMINDIDHQFGWVNAQNIFNVKGTDQTAVLFDKYTDERIVLPTANRRDRKQSYGSDPKIETFALPLTFYNHGDALGPDDLQGWSSANSDEKARTLGEARATKMTELRLDVDQTLEYMQVSALKGVTKTGDGTTLVDMHAEFGTTLSEIDFALELPATNVDAKIAEMKRKAVKALRGSAPIQGFDVMCGEAFFDKLIGHSRIREVYMNSQSNAVYQGNLSAFQPWGVSDVFTHRGVRFFTYPAIFNLKNGTSEKAVEDNEAWLIPRVKDLYRGYFGPSNKLSGANRVGKRMFSWEYDMPKDEGIEFQVQSAPLFFVTKPLVIQKLTTA